MTDAGSTAVWNPERVFPWLGDTVPCPTVGEKIAERLWGCPAGLACRPCRELIGLLVAVAEAARTLREAEWMVTHDWGGDRDSVLAAIDAALAALDAKTGAA